MLRAVLKGTAKSEVLREILAFVETGKGLEDEHRDRIVEGLYDHLGI